MKKQTVNSSYRWENAPLIERVDIRRQKNGRAVAYVYAKADPTLHPRRLEVRAAFRAKGWGTLSDHRDGAFVLRVNGFRTDEELLTLLHDNNYTQGTPKLTSQEIGEVKPPPGFMNYVRTNSLRVSGILYSLGNAIYIASGIHRSHLKGKVDVGQIGTGLAFGAGDILVATIGNKDDGRQLTSLLTKLKHHYVKEGIDIPVTAAIHSETSTIGKGFGSKLYDFLHTNVNVIKCLAEVVGGFFYYDAGKKQNNVWKQRTAVIFSLGFGASALIKEKKIDEEKYAQAGPLDRLWMRIQANPLRVGGLSGYSNTIFTTFGAIAERKNQLALGASGNKLYRWDFAAPAVMGVANGLYATSKKTTGGDIQTEAMVSDVYTVAAQVLNKLPEEKREAAMESTAQFLGERPEIKGTRDQIMARLIDEMNIQRQNPWFENIKLKQQVVKHRGLLHHNAAPLEATVATAATDAEKPAAPQPPVVAPAPQPPAAPKPPTPPQPEIQGKVEHQAKGLATVNEEAVLAAATGR